MNIEVTLTERQITKLVIARTNREWLEGMTFGPSRLNGHKVEQGPRFLPQCREFEVAIIR